MQDIAQNSSDTYSRKVLIAGASGLVGHALLQEALADASVSEVYVLGRRSLHLQHPKINMHVVDFSDLPELPVVDEVYLSLGTTIKQAGSQAAFRRVDFDANLAVAKAALAAGARKIGLVSAIGANAESRVFYNRVKGELEKTLVSLSPETLVIAQPSLLLGDREALGQPKRYGEKLSACISSLLGTLIPLRYRPIEASTVASALLITMRETKGWAVLTSDALQGFRHANQNAS